MPADPADRPRRARSVALPVLAAVAVGLGMAAAGSWRPGCVVAGVALAVAGVLRIALPAVRLGVLAVRARVVDASALFVSAGLLIGLAVTFPTG